MRGWARCSSRALSFLRPVESSDIGFKMLIGKGCDFGAKLSKWFAEVGRQFAGVVRLQIRVPKVCDWVEDPLGVRRTDLSYLY